MCIDVFRKKLDMIMDNQTHRIHAFKNDVLEKHDAVALKELLIRKEISQQDVIQATIERAYLVNPQLDAIQTDSFDVQTQNPYFRSNLLLSGIPTFIKDNVDLIGFPTQHGSTAFTSKVKKTNAKITQQIIDTGLLVLGKSKMPEFGLNAATEFQNGEFTKNPWHSDYSCGASSGGSAALVAAGVVTIAHANDGGGSIRIPAANCGLVGLKPTRGRFYANEASQHLPIDLVSDGVVTRSVRDTAYFFAEMERQYKSKKLPEVGLVQRTADKKLRIALVLDSLQTQTDLETRNAVLRTAKLLEHNGHHIEELKLPIPDSFVDDFSYYWGSLSFMLKHLGKPLFAMDFDSVKLDNLTLGLADLYKKNFHKTPFFIHRLKKIQHIYSSIFNQFDVVLSPVLAHVSPKVGYLSPTLEFNELFERLRHYVAFTPIQNIAGAPAISLPMGLTETDQRPIGIQLSSDLGNEKILLELAYELEQAQAFPCIYD